MTTATEHPLFIPIIPGTARRGRRTEHAARFVFEQTSTHCMNLEEYLHKAVGICGVSARPFGVARMIEGLLPVTRELDRRQFFGT